MENKNTVPEDYTGIITYQNFINSYTETWFLPIYKAYTIDKNTLEQLTKHLDNYTIEMYIGTWCPDCQNEIPKLYKLLHLADYNMQGLKTIALDKNKESKQGYEKNKNINFVPTIIFLDKNRKEINRIVETPKENLEKDILKIISGEKYTPNNKL